jgi:hypothetical protein
MAGILFNPQSLSGDEAAIEEINQGQKWASGENQKGYAATAKGSRLYIAQASTASPDTAAAPTGKVVRTSAVTQATINAAESSTGSDGGDVLAAFMGVHVGTAASETQTVGLAGFAKNGSNSEENPDACGHERPGRSFRSLRGRTTRCSDRYGYRSGDSVSELHCNPGFLQIKWLIGYEGHLAQCQRRS